ncbi:unnamed protein product [Trifolium pratense]|uniref:Uncharacterized protein n=1 Tax=Trifolium pratense TaxID=57577 RepID=A0ACB0JDZ4_TRIPR|nr:unnamed protein product [Trifolium pratense]
MGKINGHRDDDDEVIEEIKVLSWKWWLCQPKIAHSLLYEWQMEPNCRSCVWRAILRFFAALPCSATVLVLFV